MKRIVLLLLAIVSLSVFAQAVTLIEKSETTPEFILAGHVWNRYTVEYLNDKLVANQMSIARNYISMKLNGNDYNSNITLDIVNKLGAQGSGDYQLWIKVGYIEFTKVPLLAELGIKLRSGIQLMYTGTNPIWKYNLYEVPVEGRAGLSSADMGIALVGSLFEKKVNYELAMYSGNGYAKLDTDKLKALCANVNIGIIDGVNLIFTHYNRTGVTSFGVDSDKLLMSEAVLTLKMGALYDSYVALIEAQGPNSPVTSGVKQIVSFYAGYKLMDQLSVHARMDIENPDTCVTNDEFNQYYAGLLIPVAEKASLLLDYSLKQKRIQLGSDVNDNIYIGQIKWDW